MKTSPECLPCLFNRVLETAGRVAPDAWLQKKVMMDVVGALASGDLDFDRTPAEVMSDGIARVCQIVNADPFADERRRMNDALLPKLDALKEALSKQPDPFTSAARLAAIVNDVSIFSRPLDPAALVADAASRTFAIDDFGPLKEALKPAKKVLYILDNAGEIVADRLLIEAIGYQRVTAVVRQRPLMRDALAADAAQVGLPCPVTTTGCDSAGVPPSLVSSEFRQLLDHAAVVIAKGEACFQTLEEGPYKAFYLFVARCCCTARHLNKNVGDAFCLAREAVSTKGRNKPPTRIMRRA